MSPQPKRGRSKKDEEEEQVQDEGVEPDEDENDDDEEPDEDELEDQVEDMTGSNVSIDISDERIDVSVPRDGDPEKTLKAIGQLVKGLD